MRHQRREWFSELLADFRAWRYRLSVQAFTMNGNPARILWQRWAIKMKKTAGLVDRPWLSSTGACAAPPRSR